MPTKTFTGTVGRTYADTDFSFDVESRLPPRHPDVVYIALDDTGFASLGCYGNDVIHTPNIDALAADGLRYNNFHTTAICSATRASLLTGVNHHEAGVCSVIETETGLSNARGQINPEYATVAELLHERDYATACFGKWHLTNRETPTGPFDGWPLQKGFDRYYGTLRAMGDQYHPILTQDNTFVDQPKSEEEGYHFSEDIVDHAIHYVSEQVNGNPGQPYFLYLSFGATHTPFQAPRAYIERYRGAFDAGWDAMRERWLKRQKELGIVPADAELSARNEEVEAWDALGPDERRLYARYAEVFAGFLEHTDAQIGRFIDYLKRIGHYENTLIVLFSDNGASSEGGRRGKFNSRDLSDAPAKRLVRGIQRHDDLPRDYERALAHADELGGPSSMPHYPTGWANAFNTPFPWYKVWTFEGGTRDALIVTYPALIRDAGGIRGQYAHVSDVTPTVMEVLGAKKPASVKGVAQRPFTGTPFAYTFDNAAAPDRKTVQHYEIWGNRSIYKDGWVAVVNHIKAEGDYARDRWELYHVAEDFSEAHDVAAEYPDKLRELQDEFLVQAARHNVFPMMELSGKRAPAWGSSLANRGRARASRTFLAVVDPIALPDHIGVDTDHAPHALWARVVRRPGGAGVIFSLGDRFGGLSLFVQDGRLRFAYNDNVQVFEVEASEPLPDGDAEVGYRFELAGDGARVTLLQGVSGAADGTAGDAAVPSGADARLAGLQPVGALEVPKLFEGRNWAKTIGANPYTAVTDSYKAPFAFEGEVDELVIEQLTEPGGAKERHECAVTREE